MNLFVGVTDKTWYDFLRIRKPDEVNFWQPGGQSRFRSLQPGEIFLFKLHSPYNFIVGGGIFAHSNIFPASITWQSFGVNNGANSLMDMRHMIEKLRHKQPSVDDYSIGCIILTQPFFFPENQWLDVPSDWKKNIVQGKRYDTETTIGKKLWDDIQFRFQAEHLFVKDFKTIDNKERFGKPHLIKPRLGQGGFRTIVTDVYNRKCAITQEKTLPALQAAHIKPYSEEGPHNIQNGILLRADLHGLLDSGYMTISTDFHLEVSKKIHDDFDNGEEYKRLHGKQLILPSHIDFRPGIEFIRWHNQNKYKG